MHWTCNRPIKCSLLNFSFIRPGQQPQLVQTIQQNPQIVQIQQQQNQQTQPVQMQQVTVQQQQPQAQSQQRKGLTLSVSFVNVFIRNFTLTITKFINKICNYKNFLDIFSLHRMSM